MKNSAAKLAAMQNLWDLYRSISAKRGLNVSERSARCAERRRRSLQKYVGRASFDKLRRAGCSALPLAITIAIMKPSRSFENKWQTITGSTRQRKQKIQAIEKAANVLEDLLGSLVDVMIEDRRGTIDIVSRKKLRNELISPNDDVLDTVKQPFMSDPAIIVRALRTYASILQMFESPRNSATLASSDMFAKYLFSAYVYRATGRFHDEEVSTLIGEVLGIPYEVTAHRMWRMRNYKRIDKNLSELAEMLFAFGIISAT